MRRPQFQIDLDPFDDPEADELDGFFIDERGVDTQEELCYNEDTIDDQFCEWGVGDEDGFCIRDQYKCHYEGCPKASPNE